MLRSTYVLYDVSQLQFTEIWFVYRKGCPVQSFIRAWGTQTGAVP